MFRLGLDFHGVITRDPKFYSRLSRAINKGGGEVHVITGIPFSEKIEFQLAYHNIAWSRFFSIQDHLISLGHTPVIREEDNSTWFDNLPWDSAKGIYCKENKINVHYDDTEKYFEYFETPYILV